MTAVDLEFRFPAWVDAWSLCLLAQWPQWGVRLIYPRAVTYQWRVVGSEKWREETKAL